MVRHSGTPRRPQIVFVGFDSGDPSYQAMSAMAAHAALVEADAVDAWLRQVRVAEWDVMVTRNSDAASLAPSHMFVMAMGGFSSGLLTSKRKINGASARSYASSGLQPSPRLEISTDLEPPALQRLVNHDLVPWLESCEQVPYMVGRSIPALAANEGEFEGTHFVLDADRHIVAGHFRRSRQQQSAASGWCLALPHVPVEPALWLRAVLDIWQEQSPQRFADLPTWWEGDDYRSSAEIDALQALERVDEEHADALRAYQAQRQYLQASLLEAEIASAAGLRRLLTEQGDPLVAAVHEALEYVGFAVVDADSERGTQAGKLEDLRVSDPSVPQWTNVTEVKGYSGGAKTRDLLTLSRYASAYALSSGAAPTSRWYVVNHFMNDPPDGRPVILQGADEDLAVFASDGGLAIDTRELFAMVRRVETGDLQRTSAREVLRQATGRLSLP